MKSFGWQDLVWAVAIGAATLGAWLFFRTPEPARTGLELIAQVCARPSSRAEAIARHVADPLELVRESEGEQSLSHVELEQRLAELDVVAPGCSFELQDWALRPGARGSTWLEGVLVYSGSQLSDAHAQRWPLRAAFRERELSGGARRMRLERLVLGPREAPAH